MVSDSYIYSPGKFTAIIGVNNLVVINDDNALLICDKNKSQDVRKIIDYLKINKYTDFL